MPPRQKWRAVDLMILIYLNSEKVMLVDFDKVTVFSLNQSPFLHRAYYQPQKSKSIILREQ